MKFEELTKEDKELVEEAKKVAKKFSEIKWEGNVRSTVGAALRTKDGNVYSAPNIVHLDSASCSVCAEYSAILKAYSEGHREIDTIIAYWHGDEDKQKLLYPCGKCREFMHLFGNPWVVINTDDGPRKVKLDELLPFAANW